MRITFLGTNGLILLSTVNHFHLFYYSLVLLFLWWLQGNVNNSSFLSFLYFLKLLTLSISSGVFGIKTTTYTRLNNFLHLALMPKKSWKKTRLLAKGSQFRCSIFMARKLDWKKFCLKQSELSREFNCQ